ncbi:MAG TPA: hypothetical protein VEY92_05680 [Pseudoxanthomonas sp.]|nr:hypothetical protein [Pseudoxanthomonas sp.]
MNPEIQKKILAAAGRYVRKLLGEQEPRLKAIEDKLKALESSIAERKGFEYQGIYEQGVEYMRGDFVTHAGSLWHANTKTNARPGESNKWTLAVKKGRDA